MRAQSGFEGPIRADLTLSPYAMYNCICIKPAVFTVIISFDYKLSLVIFSQPEPTSDLRKDYAPQHGPIELGINISPAKPDGSSGF